MRCKKEMTAEEIGVAFFSSLDGKTDAEKTALEKEFFEAMDKLREKELNGSPYMGGY